MFLGVQILQSVDFRHSEAVAKRTYTHCIFFIKVLDRKIIHVRAEYFAS